MATPTKSQSAIAIIAALKEYGIEFTPAREKALLKTISGLYAHNFTNDQVSTYVATKVAFITKQLKAIGLDTGLGDTDGNGKISPAELAALKAEIKASAKTAADSGSAPGDTTTTVSLTGDKSSATEGKDTVTYTVKGTAGATYTWTVDDTHVNDVVTAAGTVTLGANGEGTFTVVAKQDNVTESAEVVKVTLLDSTASVVANTNLIIQEDPGAAAALAVDATSITEGGTAATFTVTGLAGSTYTWTIDSNHVSDVDLAGNVITLDATGKATFTVKAKQDNTAESAEVTTISLLDATGVVVGTKLLTIVEDPLVGATFTLTTGIDTVAGTVSNDTINSLVSGALSPFDNIDGGDGTDTLNVTDTAALATSANVTVKNVEVANLLSAAGIKADTSAWTGLTTLNTNSVGTTTITAASTANVTATVNTLTIDTATVNGGNNVTVTATGATTGQVSVGSTTAPTGEVSISKTVTGLSGGTISVTGGTKVNVTQVAGNAVNTTQTTGQVVVTGSDLTKSVTVAAPKAATASATVAGVVNNTVLISDVNGGSDTKDGTITTVSISGYTTAAITDNALTTLSLTNGSGNIIIDNSGLGILATNTTLGLTLDGLTGGTLDDADVYTTLNVTTANNASTLANITLGAVTDVTVDGTKGLTLTSAAGLSALKTVTVKGSAGIVADLSGATVTTVDTSATTGASTVTIDPSKASFTGGAGVDTVSLTNVASTKAISLGAGDDFLTLNNGSVPTAVISGGDGTDTLSLSAANAATASGNATFAGKVTAFEKVVLTGATNQTVDLSVLGNFNYVTTSGGNGLTLSNLPTGGTLVLNGAGTAYTIGNSAFAAGTNDVVNLNLTDGSGAAVSFASTGITASGVETFAITTADTNTTTHLPVVDLVTLLGNSVKTITVAGNAGLNLTAASTALTNVDASAITAGGFTFTTGALAADATIKGSAAYVTNTVNFSAATGIVTYTGGDGDDVINASNGKANVIDLGKGGLFGNSVTGLAGNQTITALDGDDTVELTTGNNIVNLGDGDNSFTATSGNNTYTGGTGIDTVVIGSGANIIHLGGGTSVNTVTVGAAAGLNVIDTTSTGVDTVVLGGIQTAAGYYTSVSGLTAGDIINFTAVGTTASEATLGAKITLGGNASFANYLDAAVAGSATDALNWFQFGGNTYVTVDNNASATFSDGSDSVIELVGTVDLSTAVNAAGVLTLH